MKSKESTDCRRCINIYYLRVWKIPEQQISKGIKIVLSNSILVWNFPEQQISKGKRLRLFLLRKVWKFPEQHGVFHRKYYFTDREDECKRISEFL